MTARLALIHDRITIQVDDFIRETGRDPTKVILGHIEYKQLKEYIHRFAVVQVDPSIEGKRGLEFRGCPVEETELDSCIAVTREGS